jgi:TPR repeat protein
VKPLYELWLLELLPIGGNGIPQNIEKGIQLCVKGAELGAINAQQKLRKVFFYGDYLLQDYQQAFKWLNHLATRINPESAYLLALYYDSGIGIEVDTRQALKWYEIAASQGIKDTYIPAAALYWREFTHNDNPELLAKSYLWTPASCQVNNIKPESSKLLMTQILKVTPVAWQEKLNIQVEIHTKKFTPLNQNVGC